MNAFYDQPIKQFLVLLFKIHFLGYCSSRATALECDASTCLECLDMGCEWIAENLCVQSCTDIADSTCYSTQIFPEKTELEICELYTQAVEDEMLCGALCTDCSTCVTTLMSDGVSSCVWYEDSKTCGTTLCHLDECGSTTCELPPSCDSNKSCMECLDNNCAWAAGLCLNLCEEIADVPCYSELLYPNETKEEICEKEESDSANALLCSSATDCNSCIETSLVDDSQACRWFSSDVDSDGACCFPGSGCELIGPGYDTCDSILPPSCGSSMSCFDCINNDCAWTSIQSCFDSCDIIADVGCYTAEAFPNKSSIEICMIQENDSENVAVCSVQADCESCQSTVLSDGATTCQWYQADDDSSTGVCCDGSAGCGFLPPPVPVCPQKCDSLTSCDDCLNSNCAWTVGNCLESCDIIADVACYSAESFPNKSPNEICVIQENDSANVALCATQTDCESCQATVFPDSSTSCQWHQVDDDDSTGICCDGSAGCGFIPPPVLTCPKTCDSLTNCDDCLKSNCAWSSVGNCIESCDIIADVACYSRNIFTHLESSAICPQEDQTNQVRRTPFQTILMFISSFRNMLESIMALFNN